jgi:hypothetical protein
MIYDHKNREYKLIGCDQGFTYLECATTGDKIKIANNMFTSSGFKGA